VHCRVAAGDGVRHAFSHGFPAQHVERLAVIELRISVTEHVLQVSGEETTVVRMHSGNGEQEEANHGATACFGGNCTNAVRMARLDAL
jgi:hemoglobin